MGILKKIKNWFFDDKKVTFNKKTLSTVDICDDVWVKIENVIYKGWLWKKSKNNLYVLLFNNTELQIPYKRPYDSDIIHYNDYIIYLNDPELCLP